MTPPHQDFLAIMRPQQITQFFRERMFPQGRWFEMRAAETAATHQPDGTTGAVPQPEIARETPPAQ
jgi:hypothetical protein